MKLLWATFKSCRKADGSIIKPGISFWGSEYRVPEVFQQFSSHIVDRIEPIFPYSIFLKYLNPINRIPQTNKCVY